MNKNMTDVKLVSEALRRIIEPLIDQRLSAVLDEAYRLSCLSTDASSFADAMQYDALSVGVLRGAALALGIDIDTMISVYNNFVTELELAKQEKEENT